MYNRNRMFLAPPTILVGPGGGGKHHLLNEILHRRSCEGPTLTNRPPRALDTGGDFLHITSPLFNALLKCGACTDDVSVTKFYSYATCHAVKVRGGNRCPLFVTDIDTAAIFRSEGPCHIIQVLPGDAAELAERLEARHDASPELIKERLKEAQEQIKFLAESALADFTIINSDFDTAVQDFEEILDRRVRGTDCYTHHCSEAIQRILDSFDYVIPRATDTGFPITPDMLDVQNKLDALYVKACLPAPQSADPQENTEE